MEKINFNHVTFKYSDSKRFQIKDQSFTLPTNKWIAIVGHNGSGKSTIVRLLNGLLKPASGEIHIGDCTMIEHWAITGLGNDVSGRLVNIAKTHARFNDGFGSQIGLKHQIIDLSLFWCDRLVEEGPCHIRTISLIHTAHVYNDTVPWF